MDWGFQDQSPSKILWDLQKIVLVDVVIPSDSHIRKQEHEKREKYHWLKEELERMRGVKTSAVQW